MRHTARPGIHGVVLAAGRSRRMGRPKPLLVRDGRTLLEHAASSLTAACDDVWIVVCEAVPEVVEEAARLARPVLAPDDPAAEPLDSIRLALAAVPPDASGILVIPVDCPFVRPATVTKLLEGTGAAVVPVQRGEPGHPVLIRAALFEALRTAALPEGLRSLLELHSADVEHVDVADPGVLVDLDTPADARAYGTA